MGSQDDPRTVNLAHWEAMAAVHGEGRDSYYDVDALVAGRSSLGRLEEEAVALAVGDVAGRDVLHLQCHLGFDAVTLARRGARVAGADFSPTALAKARAIAERCGVTVEYVEADSTALPGELHERFDLVYATIGVITWIADLGAWMRSVASVLRAGGRLALVDSHPFYNAVGSLDPLLLDYPYSGQAEMDEPGSYANPDAQVDATRTIERAHSLGEVVTHAIEAGLRVEALREHLETDFDPRGGVLPREADGLHRLRIDGVALPVMFTLVATRP
jgi:SAM-dependent methyltransferase